MQTSASWSVLAPPTGLLSEALHCPVPKTSSLLRWERNRVSASILSASALVVGQWVWSGFRWANRRTGVVFKSLWPLSRSLGGQNTSWFLTPKCTARKPGGGLLRGGEESLRPEFCRQRVKTRLCYYCITKNLSGLCPRFLGWNF